MTAVTLSRVRREVLFRWRAVRAATPGGHGRVPFAAFAAAASVLLAALVTRPLLLSLPAATAARWGWSADLVARGDLWRLATAVPLTRDPFMLTSTIASLLVAVGALERLAGHARAAVTVAAGALAGYAGVTVIVLALRGTGVDVAARWAATLDYGASAGVAACAGAIAGLLRVRAVTAGLALVVAGGLVLHHQIADWEHAVSFTLAVALTRPAAPR